MSRNKSNQVDISLSIVFFLPNYYKINTILSSFCLVRYVNINDFSKFKNTKGLTKDKIMIKKAFWLEGKGITQEDLASVLEVSRQTIGSLENGRYNPSINLAFKIARYFEMSIEDIFIYEEEVKWIKVNQSMFLL